MWKVITMIVCPIALILLYIFKSSEFSIAAAFLIAVAGLLVGQLLIQIVSRIIGKPHSINLIQHINIQ